MNGTARTTSNIQAGTTLLFFLLLILPACTALQREATGERLADQPREVLALAAQAVRDLRAGPQGDRLDAALARCRAALVAPDLFKLGLVMAGGGGPAVLLVRQPDGGFGEPVFYTMSQAGWGAQGGIRRTRLVLAFLTDKVVQGVLEAGLDAALEGGLVLGNLDVSAGADTGSLSGKTLAFSTSDGLFGGVSLDGVALKVQTSYNAQYHQALLAPAAIAALPPRPDPAADALRQALAGN